MSATISTSAGFRPVIADVPLIASCGRAVPDWWCLLGDETVAAGCLRAWLWSRSTLTR